jgi:hypothetical protein
VSRVGSEAALDMRVAAIAAVDAITKSRRVVLMAGILTRK